MIKTFLVFNAMLLLMCLLALPLGYLVYYMLTHQWPFWAVLCIGYVALLVTSLIGTALLRRLADKIM